MKLPLLAAGGALSMLVAVTGCGSGGDDVPANAVAKVGGTVISTADFDQRLRLAVKSQSQGNSQPITYEPPDFDRCVAAKKTQEGAPEGQKGKSDETLRDECKTDYEGLRTQVMEFLIQQVWIRAEAGKVGVKVSDAEVHKEFERQKAAAFKTKKAYKEFLLTSGRTKKDILTEVGTNLRQQKLGDKMTEGKVKVSNAEIEGYYQVHKKELGKPETRSMRVVIAKTEARAEVAKQALASGQSWDSVAKEYSIDKASADNGGLLPAVTTTGDKTVDASLKNAKIGTLSEPTKTQFGWWIFEVEKVAPATVPPLKAARVQVAATLKQQKSQKALDEFAASFRERYRATTICADDYKVASCENGPEKNPTTPDKTMQSPQSQQSN